MKKLGLVLFTLLFLSFGFLAKAQDKGVGIWYNDVKDAKIEIYKAVNGKYYGKIIWLKEPNRNGSPKLDINNSSSKLKTRPVLGLLILNGFNWDDGVYEDGTIYDPKNGKTYSCKITPDGTDKLNIRGYIGISLLGRTTVWTRTTR